MQPLHLLVVEDELKLLNNLCRGLGEEGFAVLSAGSAEAAARVVELYRADGYLDAAYDGARARLDARAGTVEVELRLREGVRTTVERVIFSGEQALSAGALSAEVRIAPGDPLAYERLEATRAALVALYARRALRGTAWMRPAGMLAAALAFLELSLEVRHGFQGSVLSGPAVSDAEWYAYSAAWLAFAGALLAFGIRGGSSDMRYVSLAVLLLTAGKVFVLDMDELTGFYRVLSFLGLGLCLVGVSFLYQRYVFRLDRMPPGG
jgi:hypothetical protein